MSTARRLFMIVAIVTLVLDQVSKIAVFFGMDLQHQGQIPVLPFFDLSLVWNRGISYGLFQQSTEMGRWLLTFFKLAVAVGLTIWAWRSGERRLNLGLGLIAGGAVGNAIDRIWHGAVLDFAHFFWGNFSWYVFNVADAAIVVGVIVLLYDSVRSGQKPSSAA